jgi:peptide/nickel transport system permease protein
MKHWLWCLSVLGILLLYGFALTAPFIAPYSPQKQFRDYPYAPPTSLHFVDKQGHFSLRPFIYDYVRSEEDDGYQTTEDKLFLDLWVSGAPYEWLGFTSRTHLIGLSDSSRQLFLFGTDSLGRDLFSRVLLGARFSLSVGVVAILFASLMGVVFGMWAGYGGSWTDRVVMRTCDLFLSLPALFLVLGLRAVFPQQMSARGTFWMMVLIFTLVGWSAVTRTVRGQVLTLKKRPYVLAARAAGASNWRIITRHILPFTTNYLLVQCTVFIPIFIMGEITLSFLGVGVQEPHVSWGSLLATASSVHAITLHPWLLCPVLFIFLTAFSFNLLGDELKALGKQRPQWW